VTLAGKILVVDDHVDLADNLAEILENAGYQAVVADSAEAALDRLERNDIAALITDYRLPGLNGAELILEIRRRGSPIPAVVMSAFTDDQTIDRASRAGALEVLPKPLDLPHLFQVAKALGRDDGIVLVVEDNRELAENLAEALGEQGFQTNVTGSVAAALAARPRPGAAIVDFALPDGTGIDVAERLKARDPGVKLLFVSGHGPELERRLSGPLAREDRLEKPVPVERLLEWVKTALGHGRQTTHPDR
jgi:two-component system, response regulator PdtaR